MMTHVSQFLSNKTEGLARYAEQAMESYHSNIKATLQRHNMKGKHRADKPEGNRRGCVVYSGRHLGCDGRGDHQ